MGLKRRPQPGALRTPLIEVEPEGKSLPFAHQRRRLHDVGRSDVIQRPDLIVRPPLAPVAEPLPIASIVPSVTSCFRAILATFLEGWPDCFPSCALLLDNALLASNSNLELWERLP